MSDTGPITLPQAGPTRRQRRPLRGMVALILREMSTRYGRSPGGYAWSVLEPLGMIVILAIGFSLLFRSPALGTSFILFFATGFVPFSTFQKISNVSARSIDFSRALLAYPVLGWGEAVLARLILNTLVQALVACAVLGGILLVQETTAILSVGPILLAMSLAVLIGFGVGLVNCVLIGFFPAWENVWTIATRPLFLGSGVLILYRDLPPLAQDILWFNPLLHIAGIMREGFYPTYVAQYVSLPFTAGVALGLVALGLLLMQRFHLELLER